MEDQTAERRSDSVPDLLMPLTIRTQKQQYFNFSAKLNQTHKKKFVLHYWSKIKVKKKEKRNSLAPHVLEENNRLSLLPSACLLVDLHKPSIALCTNHLRENKQKFFLRTMKENQNQRSISFSVFTWIPTRRRQRLEPVRHHNEINRKSNKQSPSL